MKLSKYFVRNISFSRKMYKNIFLLKSKNHTHPFRQTLHNISLVCFSQSCIFENVKIYKNFDFFNKSYFVFFSKGQIKTIH